MFPWPRNGGSPAAILVWYGRIGAIVIGWLAGAAADFTRWFAGAVADFVRGLNPARPGSLMKWVLVGVFAAMSLTVWDALTFRWLASLFPSADFHG